MMQEQKRQFWKYVLPSMFAMLLSGFYAIIDGFFVGNAVGESALAAINIAYPIQVVLNATAVGIGIGGAVALSYFKGKKAEKQQRIALGNSIMLLLVLGLVLSLLLRWNAPQLLRLLGADDTTFLQAMEYIQVILIGGMLPVFGNGLHPLLRSDGRVLLATACMSSGLIVNIVFDYIFVFVWGWGLHGAALATILAQGVVALSSFGVLWYLRLRTLSRKDYLPDPAMIKRILKTAVSPFGQTLLPCIVIILTNWMCLKHGGTQAVTVFSIVSYVLASAQLLLQGIGDGVQPLFSYYHGKKEEHAIHYFYKKAFVLSCFVALVLSSGVFLTSEWLSIGFGVTQALLEETKIALWITALSFPFIGVVRLTIAIFYATQKEKNSAWLVYLEPCFILPFFLLVFGNCFALKGIWCAYPATQVVLCMISLILKSPNVVSSFHVETQSINPEFAKVSTS